MSTARFHLKAATAEAHDRLDALFSRFDLSLADDYGRFLQAQAGPFLAVETALDAGGAGRLLADWPERRRADALRDDLVALGLPVSEPVERPVYDSEAAMLGAIYVLEGSRLGGAMLVRRVPDTAPKRFLTPGNPLLWREFVSVLDERLSSEGARAEAAAAASVVFDLFTRSARELTGADRP
ncbi:biliverdin-producing heme oxygenase [Brevundimonas sp. NPDC092305]|uniref:biliverdin-producing heme oxygenase n=1 Tax=Brevundimonas sp. NPDC092305 TaxID=3363957 RepID=UPI003802D1A7